MEESGDVSSGRVMDQLYSGAKCRLSAYIKFAEGIVKSMSKERTYIARLEVETSGIEVERLCKIGDAHSEMTEFVHGRRTFVDQYED